MINLNEYLGDFENSDVNIELSSFIKDAGVYPMCIDQAYLSEGRADDPSAKNLTLHLSGHIWNEEEPEKTQEIPFMSVYLKNKSGMPDKKGSTVFAHMKAILGIDEFTMAPGEIEAYDFEVGMVITQTTDFTLPILVGKTIKGVFNRLVNKKNPQYTNLILMNFLHHSGHTAKEKKEGLGTLYLDNTLIPAFEALNNGFNKAIQDASIPSDVDSASKM